MRPSHSVTATDGVTRQQSDSDEQAYREDLQHIRSELLHYRPNIPDTEGDLRQAVSDWLDVAFAQDNRSVGAAVSRRLGEMRRQYAMMRKPGDADGASRFPDACSDCPHYGVACPVIKDHGQVKRRKRLIEQDLDGDQLLQEMRELAMDNSCGVLLEELDDWETDLQPMVGSGQQLLRLVEDVIQHQDPADEIEAAIRNARRAGPDALTAGQATSSTEQAGDD